MEYALRRQQTPQRIFRMRPAERLHRFVRIVHNEQPRTGTGRLFEKSETCERQILCVVDHNEFGKILPAQRGHRKRPFNKQHGRVKSVLPRIIALNRRRIFLPQCEGKTPLDIKPFRLRSHTRAGSPRCPGNRVQASNQRLLV